MNIAQFLAIITVQAVRNWGNSLKLDTVQQWIKENSNRDDYGRGYAGNHLPDCLGNSFAEIRRESVGDGVQVVASVYLDARQGTAATKTWKAKRLDSKLEKFFGHNLRIRIDV